MKHLSAFLLLFWINYVKSQNQGQTPLTRAPFCTPVYNAEALPQDMRTNFRIDTAFYKKVVFGPENIPIVSSIRLPDEALFRAQHVLWELSKNVDSRIFASIANRGVKAVILARGEGATDIPEFRNEPNSFDQYRAVTWDKGFMATEENLMCEPNEAYRGQCVFLHEAAHAVHRFGLANGNPVNPNFNGALNNAFGLSRQQNRWTGTYAASSVFEYFADTSAGFHGCLGNGPNNIYTTLNVRNASGIQTYDPALFNLLSEVYKNTAYRRYCDATPVCLNPAIRADVRPTTPPQPVQQVQTPNNNSNTPPQNQIINNDPNGVFKVSFREEPSINNNSNNNNSPDLANSNQFVAVMIGGTTPNSI